MSAPQAAAAASHSVRSGASHADRAYSLATTIAAALRRHPLRLQKASFARDDLLMAIEGIGIEVGPDEGPLPKCNPTVFLAHCGLAIEIDHTGAAWGAEGIRIRRYASHPAVTVILLVTPHGNVTRPASIAGKPVVVGHAVPVRAPRGRRP